MIMDDKDFQPVDYDEVVKGTQKAKGLNLNNVIAFLKEQGADDEIIDRIEKQCSPHKAEPADQKGKLVSSPEQEQQSTSKNAAESQNNSSAHGIRNRKKISQQGQAQYNQRTETAMTSATA